jgi:hypothetical protein
MPSANSTRATSKSALLMRALSLMRWPTATTTSRRKWAKCLWIRVFFRKIVVDFEFYGIFKLYSKLLFKGLVGKKAKIWITHISEKSCGCNWMMAIPDPETGLVCQSYY